MPSFRAILYFTVTAFTAFSAAAPFIGSSANVAIAHRRSSLPMPVDTDATATSMGQDVRPAGPQGVGSLFSGVTSTTSAIKRADAVQSLPTTLLDVQSKLQDVTSTLNNLVDNKTTVDVTQLKPIVTNVQVIVAGALLSVKAIIGQPAATIFALDGKVLTAEDVAQLLMSILALISNILATVVHATTSVALVGPLVAPVASLLAQLVGLILNDLNVGISGVISPLITPTILNALTTLNLNAVVAALN
ncbi:hypothetical protein H0H92_000752 [Tricholoma furcatifolium]|nr:hypothetical protein H0H92_000752 [Tricholoma furcatifolium]